MTNAERKSLAFKWLMNLNEIVIAPDAANTLRNALRVTNWPNTYAADALRYAVLGLDLERKDEHEEDTNSHTGNNESCGFCAKQSASLDARERLLFNRCWVVGVDFGREPHRCE